MSQSGERPKRMTKNPECVSAPLQEPAGSTGARRCASHVISRREGWGSWEGKERKKAGAGQLPRNQAPSFGQWVLASCRHFKALPRRHPHLGLLRNQSSSSSGTPRELNTSNRILKETGCNTRHKDLRRFSEHKGLFLRTTNIHLSPGRGLSNKRPFRQPAIKDKTDIGHLTLETTRHPTRCK